MEYKGKIKFYEETMDILFPEDFNLCIKKLGEMIGLTEGEVLKKIMLYYNDEDGDKVVLSGDADYEIFINYIKENENKKEKITLHLELNENSEYLVKKMSQEIMNYKENISKEVKIDKKDSKDSLEIKEEFDNIINEDNKINDKDSDIKNNIDNNKDDLDENQNENINFKNNIIIENKTNNEVIPPPEINEIKEPSFTYPETCYNCKTNPLLDIFYYCTKCDKRICSKCELVLGPQHPHPIYKIQTYDQYMNSDIKLKENVGEIVEGVKGKVKDLIYNYNNMLNKNKNNNDNNKYKELIQKMRNDFDFNNTNITDEQIEEALEKANGNIENALGFLFN